MTYQPPAFASFNKSPLFQVYDKDSVDHQVRLVNKAANGATFETAAIYAPNKAPRGLVRTNFVSNCFVNGVIVDGTVHTDADKASSVTLKKGGILKAVPGLNGSFTASSSEKDLPGKPRYGVFTGIALDYTRPGFAATAGLLTDEDSQHAVNASAALGFEGFSVGGEVKVVKASGAEWTAKTYNAGLEYKKGLYTVGAKSDDKFNKVVVTALRNKLGATGAINAGLQVKADVQAPKSGKPQREVIASFSEVISPQSSFKAAAVLTGDNAKTVVFTVDHKLKNPDVALTATVVAAIPGGFYAPWPVSKFGVGITFGDY